MREKAAAVSLRLDSADRTSASCADRFVHEPVAVTFMANTLLQERARLGLRERSGNPRELCQTGVGRACLSPTTASLVVSSAGGATSGLSRITCRTSDTESRGRKLEEDATARVTT